MVRLGAAPPFPGRRASTDALKGTSADHLCNFAVSTKERPPERGSVLTRLVYPIIGKNSSDRNDGAGCRRLGRDHPTRRRFPRGAQSGEPRQLTAALDALCVPVLRERLLGDRLQSRDQRRTQLRADPAKAVLAARVSTRRMPDVCQRQTGCQVAPMAVAGELSGASLRDAACKVRSPADRTLARGPTAKAVGTEATGHSNQHRRGMFGRDRAIRARSGQLLRFGIPDCATVY